MIDGICQRYSVLPSQLEGEDLALMRMLNVLYEAGDLGDRDDKARPRAPREPDSPLASLMESAAPVKETIR